MKKKSWIDAGKKLLGLVVEFGCMEICSRGIDRLTDRYTNNASKVAMRMSGVALGGYLGSKASGYLNETIDKGIKFAQEHTGFKPVEDKEEIEDVSK